LPVPNRMTLEQQLMAKGYEIKGDTAIKKMEARGGFQGFLAAVFGSFMSERLELPPECEVDDFLNLAANTLSALPGWPSPRIEALRSCVKLVPAEVYRNAATRRHISLPQIKTPQPGLVRQRAKARPVSSGNEPREWMQDFISANRQPDGPPPRLTSTALLKRNSSSPTKAESRAQKQEWMKDFAPQAPPAADKNRKPDKSEMQTKPEWKDDFE
jgi:hypothetical protein